MENEAWERPEVQRVWRTIAGRLRRSYGWIPYEDIGGYAAVGLLRAMGPFDENQHSWAWLVVAGWMRSVDWMRESKVLGRDGRYVAPLREADCQRVDHADERGSTMPYVSYLLEEVAGKSTWDRLKVMGRDEPDAAVIAEGRDVVDEIMVRLVGGERRILREYWLEGRTLKEIGERMGVSEGRMCQLKKGVWARVEEIVKSFA